MGPSLLSGSSRTREDGMVASVSSLPTYILSYLRAGMPSAIPNRLRRWNIDRAQSTPAAMLLLPLAPSRLANVNNSDAIHREDDAPFRTKPAG